MKYKIVVEWRIIPSTMDGVCLACFGSLTGNNREYMLKISQDIIKTLRNVKTTRVEEIENIWVV